MNMFEGISFLMSYIDGPIRNWGVHIYKYHKDNKDNFLKKNYISQRRYFLAQRKWNSKIQRIYQKTIEKKQEDISVETGFIELQEYEIKSNVTGDLWGIVVGHRGKLYRAIRSDRIDEFIDFWKSGILQALWECNCIPYLSISKFYITNYPILVETEVVDIVHPKIWTLSDIKENALLISLIKSVVEKRGYMLIDGHSNNIGYKNGRPVLFDIGSIESQKYIKQFGGRNNNCAKEIVINYCYRIIFSMLGNMALSRSTIYDEDNNGVRVLPFHRGDTNREYIYALRKYRFFHLKSGFRYQLIVHKVFDELVIKPHYLDLLFDIEKMCIGELPYTKFSNAWISIAKKNKIVVNTVSELGGCGGAICKSFIDAGIATSGMVLEYNENYAEITKKMLTDDRIHVVLTNYLYTIPVNLIGNTKTDLAIAYDVINNSSYMPLHIDPEILIKKLSEVTYRYLLCSVKEGVIRGLFENRLISVMDFEKYSKRYFKILDMSEKQEDDSYIYLMEKC